MGNFFLGLFSGGVAVFSYLAILFLFLWNFYFLDEAPKQYTSYKETTFNIELFEEVKTIEKKEKNIQKTQKTQKKIENVLEHKQESTSKTANVGVGINELFQQVEAKRNVPKEALKPQSQDDKIARRKKALQSIQKIEDNLKEDIEKIISNVEVKKTMSFAVPKGEYNEFYAKVQEILYENWNPIKDQNENQAEVQIAIDYQGKFSYEILKLSGNLEFDKALKEFLDIMCNKEFPQYKGGNRTNIIVIFKTEV